MGKEEWFKQLGECWCHLLGEGTLWGRLDGKGKSVFICGTRT